MNEKLYITNEEIFLVAYGLNLAHAHKLATGQPTSKDLMDNLTSHADIGKSLKPEKVLGVYQNQNGIFAVITKDGYSHFEISKAQRFNPTILRGYVSGCGSSDKVVITETRELSNVVKDLAIELKLEPIIF